MVFGCGNAAVFFFYRNTNGLYNEGARQKKGRMLMKLAEKWRQKRRLKKASRMDGNQAAITMIKQREALINAKLINKKDEIRELDEKIKLARKYRRDAMELKPEDLSNKRDQEDNEAYIADMSQRIKDLNEDKSYLQMEADNLKAELTDIQTMLKNAVDVQNSEKKAKIEADDMCRKYRINKSDVLKCGVVLGISALGLVMKEYDPMRQREIDERLSRIRLL